MRTDRDDAEVLRLSLTDPASFEELYSRYFERVHGYLRRRVGDELAEDLTAETFVRAFRGRDRYRVEYETALPWLFGIAGKLIADHRRAETRRLATLESLASSTPLSADAPEPPGASPELFNALRQLSTGDRDALLLVVVGDLTYEQAAQALELPIGTIRSRIARARQQLRDRLTVLERAPSTSLRPGESHA